MSNYLDAYTGCLFVFPLKNLICFCSGLCITSLQKSESFYMTEDFNCLNIFIVVIKHFYNEIWRPVKGYTNFYHTLDYEV